MAIVRKSVVALLGINSFAIQLTDLKLLSHLELCGPTWQSQAK
jgi:hypothetical protein